MIAIRNFFLIFLLLLSSALWASAQSPEQLLAAGRADDAVAALRAKLAAAPGDAASYNLLCRTYFSLGNWDAGIAACERAVALQPENGRYHLWLGRIYGEKADQASFFSAFSLARKVRGEFEKAVALSPMDVAARTDLAEFYLEAPSIVGGGRDKAEAEAKTIAKLDQPKADWVAGRIAQKNHDLVSAERSYRAAVDHSHGSALAWLNLAFFYRTTQRLDDMEDAINHAASAQMNQPEVLMEAAEVLIRTGRDFPTATRLLRRYLSNNTVEEAPAFKAHYLLGTVLEKEGNPQDAAQEYRAALSLASGFSRAQEALNRLSR
jgi:cytochrome c-type biogenesis protein CcmH/NrfG